ncbi:MAG: SH3 domain-containing protein [Chloroflexi bacterium]|nr:SH3 domain-containing protein [Chloroflexota bacterium]
MQKILIAISLVLAAAMLLRSDLPVKAQDGGDTIRLDERKLGDINAANPQPTYIFNATANQSVTIDLTAITPQLALSFTVLAPNGALVVAVGNPSEQARISDTLIFPTAGDYTIQISNVSDVEGQFILSLFRPAPEVPAVPLIAGQMQQDFLTQGSKLVFSITAIEESQLELSIASADGRFGLDINLEDEAGETVAFVSNSILRTTLTIPAGNMSYLLTLTNNHPTGEAISYTVKVNMPDAVEEEDQTITPTATVEPSPTGDGEPDLPVLPATGPCVLATRGQIVNVRSGPSTEYDIVATIGAFTIYNVLGRNEDGTWLQIDAVPEIGWVAANVTRQGGDCNSLQVQSYLPLPGSITGTVWHDLCAATPEMIEPPEGCVEVEAGIVEADGIKAAGEPAINGVEVSLLEGACSGATLLNSTISGATGYGFEDVPPGQYCVLVNAASPTNSSLLLPGKWTAPRIATSTAQFNVTVDANENRVVHFGWDYELAP